MISKLVFIVINHYLSLKLVVNMKFSYNKVFWEVLT